jgi:UDP-glucose 4-epimerase
MPSLSSAPTVLITGGAGFIGSHTCVDLLEHGYRVIAVDDFSNSHPEALERVQKIAGRSLTLHQGDLRDAAVARAALSAQPVDAVIHFAAKKAVGESADIPLEYYDINVGGTVTLLRAMRETGVHRLVFSSSCSIYGDAESMPLAESAPARPANPYARSKWMCEQVIADACTRYSDLNVIALRYFNPIGAHESGLLGEDPLGVPHNVVPYLAQVAVGRLPELSVFGDDYPTPDGTCIRDYLHVVDVADGHRVALEHLDDAAGLRIRNLGTGVGTSVTQIVAAFERASGRSIPVRIKPRRPGDVPRLIADPEVAAAEWGWRTRRTLDQMCGDAWRFQEMNPHGYSS